MFFVLRRSEPDWVQSHKDIPAFSCVVGSKSCVTMPSLFLICSGLGLSVCKMVLRVNNEGMGFKLNILIGHLAIAIKEL